MITNIYSEHIFDLFIDMFDRCGYNHGYENKCSEHTFRTYILMFHETDTIRIRIFVSEWEEENGS